MPTTWPGCRSSWPTCTRRCPPCWPSTAPGSRRWPAPPRQAAGGYVMLDGGALPAWFSRTAPGCARPGWLAGTISSRASRSAATWRRSPLHTGLLAARHVLGAERGRGGAGAGQPGHRHPVGVLRRGLRRGGERGRRARRPPGGVAADQRGRPQAAAPRHLAPQPDRLRPGGPGQGRRRGARPAAASSARRSPPQAAQLAARHRLVTRQRPTGCTRRCAACPVPLSTMGRGLDEDRAYFLAAAAAGRHAASLLPWSCPAGAGRPRASRARAPATKPRGRRPPGLPPGQH